MKSNRSKIKIITEKDASLKGINLTLESVQDSVKKFSPMDDQKSQIIMVVKTLSSSFTYNYN